MKYLRLATLMLLMILLGCIPTPPEENNVEILSINITPPYRDGELYAGDSVTQLAAKITLVGTGTIKIKWIRNACGKEYIEKTETINVVENMDSYTSVFENDGNLIKGLCWITAYDDTDSLLAISDSSWCGNIPVLPPDIDFYGIDDEGRAGPFWIEHPPFYVCFFAWEVTTSHNYGEPPTLNLHVFWDFGDGSTGWSYSSLPNLSETVIEHTYEKYGTFTVTIIASNVAGADTVIAFDYVKIEPED